MRTKAAVNVKEYVRGLSDEELEDLAQRFTQKLCGDYCEVASTLQRNKEMDQWLRSASSSSEWFDMMDEIADAVLEEQSYRDQETD